MKIITTTVLLLALTIGTASAQVRETDIVLSLSPEYPGPEESVTATVASLALDLNKANIQWSVEGGSESGGIGRKSFSFRTGPAGITMTLYVSIETANGENIQKVASLTPAGVDLLWEAVGSYIPPFYRGKALPSREGTFKVVAVPLFGSAGGKISLANLSYSWKTNGDARPSASGWGRSSITVKNGYLDRENSAEVMVSDVTGALNASGRINLRAFEPKIILYEVLPGNAQGGPIESGFRIGPEGASILAVPYFFSGGIASPDLRLDWILSGQKVPAPNPRNILSVRPRESESGEASIRVEIENMKTLFQKAEKEIRVSF